MQILLLNNEVSYLAASTSSVCQGSIYLPKPKEGRITVNMRRIINTFGSFSGIVIALKTIFNNRKWNNA